MGLSCALLLWQNAVGISPWNGKKFILGVGISSVLPNYSQ